MVVGGCGRWRGKVVAARGRGRGKGVEGCGRLWKARCRCVQKGARRSCGERCGKRRGGGGEESGRESIWCSGRWTDACGGRSRGDDEHTLRAARRLRCWRGERGRSLSARAPKWPSCAAGAHGVRTLSSILSPAGDGDRERLMLRDLERAMSGARERLGVAISDAEGAALAWLSTAAAETCERDTRSLRLRTASEARQDGVG